MTHIIYMARNKVNGKRYIGATKHSLEYRRNRHHYDAKRGGACRVFNAAIMKYGHDAFEWSILATVPSLEEAMQEEIRLIKETKPEYNITFGGRGLIGLARTPEWLKRMSDAQKGRKTRLSKEQIRNIAKITSEKLRKPIVCLNDNMWHRGIRDAAEYYSINHHGITAVLIGAQHVTGRSRLAFVFSSAPISKDEADRRLSVVLEKVKNHRANLKKGRYSPRRSVTCITDGRVFRSCKEAGAAYGVSGITVSLQCRKGGTTLSGLQFRFSEGVRVERVERSPEQIEDGLRKRNEALKRSRDTTSRAVRCRDLDVVYPSITEAARSVGAHISSVSAAIYRNGTANGLHFEFARY